MGTTGIYDLPYPDGTDLVINGDDAIQALAETIEARWNHAPAIAQVLAANPAAAIGSTLSGVPFPGTDSITGFTFDGTTFTYTGSPRMFMIQAQVILTWSAAAPGTNYQVLAEATLNIDGLSYARDLSLTPVYEPSGLAGGLTGSLTLQLAMPVILSTGQTVNVTARLVPGGTCENSQIRIYPIGPAMP